MYNADLPEQSRLVHGFPGVLKHAGGAAPCRNPQDEAQHARHEAAAAAACSRGALIFA